MELHPGLLHTWVLLLLYHAITWAAYVMAGKKRRFPIESPEPPPDMRRSGMLSMAIMALMLLVAIVIPLNRGAALYAGLTVYGCGLAISLTAIYSFAGARSGLNTGGIYRFTRNPMYIGSFFILFGTALSGIRPDPQNGVFITLIIAWAASSHRLVIREEQHLSELYGVDFDRYRSAVPRYAPLIGRYS
ncbi:MAG: hypothetical protein JW807_12170 [Spirochaetes bacterium]|nr:hypothetical protein [Spirochaetota bacterium]